MDRLLTVQEAAEYLRVSDQTVIRYIKDGELDAQKVGRQWRILETTLRLFVGREQAAK